MCMLKCLLWTTSLMGWSCLATLLHAEEKTTPVTQMPLIPRQLLFGNPEKTSPKLSSDGTKLAYLAPNAQNVLNVWVRDLENPEKPDRQVTSDQKRGIRSFLWQYEPDYILYVQDKDGDENWHLYQVHLGTLATKDLTPYEGITASILAYDPRFPHEMLILMNKRDPGLFDVYRLNLQTGQLQLDTENPGGDTKVHHWVADHNLQIRASQFHNEHGATIVRVRDRVDAPWRNFLTAEPTDNLSVDDFTADNQSLYLFSDIGGKAIRLLKANVATGEQTLIVEDAAYDLSSAMMNPVTHALEAVAVEREKLEWIVMDPQLKADFNHLAQTFKGPFTLTSRDLANQNWVVVSLSDQRPAHFYLYHRPSKALTFLFSTQPALERYKLSPMRPITFRARDGMTLHGYLTLPLGKDPHQLPTVLYVHGGPWVRDSWGLNPTVQWLANRGYAVLQINYRGSTGYGKAYLNAGIREWGAKMHDDLIDGKNWMVNQGYADPQKVAIFGGSYGGYATLVGLTFTPDAFCCGVDVVGPSNLITLLQTIPPYWGPIKCTFDVRVGRLDTEEEFLKSRSPLFKADQIKKPLLIAQGANDPRVKQAESDQIVAAMREKRLPVEYLLFADEGHGFARPENRLKFYAATEEFFSKYLGGRHEPPTPAENWDSLKR
jgi:dipeptidyl aminopeptidase/acylaminoacyl peptidase